MTVPDRPDGAHLRTLASVCTACGHMYNFHASTGRCESMPSQLERRCWCPAFVDSAAPVPDRPDTDEDQAPPTVSLDELAAEGFDVTHWGGPTPAWRSS